MNKVTNDHFHKYNSFPFQDEKDKAQNCLSLHRKQAAETGLEVKSLH